VPKCTKAAQKAAKNKKVNGESQPSLPKTRFKKDKL
jgi:hypothetical protein